jgi:CRISPR-associated endonuclease Csn1
MKKILGLDLGSSSIGWAVVEERSKEVIAEADFSETDKIVAIGSRIVPLTTDESTQFSKGQALTKNADRTAKRTQRKGYDRYQLRRHLLLEELK